MKPLLETTHPTYLRRLVRELNEHGLVNGFYLKLPVTATRCNRAASRWVEDSSASVRLLELVHSRSLSTSVRGLQRKRNRRQPKSLTPTRHEHPNRTRPLLHRPLLPPRHRLRTTAKASPPSASPAVPHGLNLAAPTMKLLAACTPCTTRGNAKGSNADTPAPPTDAPEPTRGVFVSASPPVVASASTPKPAAAETSPSPIRPNHRPAISAHPPSGGS